MTDAAALLIFGYIIMTTVWLMYWREMRKRKR